MFGKLKLTLLLAIVALLAGCYRIDVQQGNILPDSSIKKVRKGMSIKQVKHTFGNPVLTDVFVGKRIVYVYTFKPGIGNRHEKRLIIYFSKGHVTSFTTDEKEIKGKIPSPFED